MSRKLSQQSDAGKLIERLGREYPKALRIAEAHYWKAVHIFDSKTHRLKSHVEDKAEARIALRLVEALGEVYGRKRRLNADERKLLEQIGPKGLSSDVKRKINFDSNVRF